MKRAARPKLAFHNRTVAQQLAICRRIADGIGRLSDRERGSVQPGTLAGAVTGAERAAARVDKLRTELRAAMIERNEKLREARQQTTRAASGLVGASGGDARTLLAAGFELESPKRSVGLPDAPGRVRAEALPTEGAVCVRGRRPLRRCSLVIQMTRTPGVEASWKPVAVTPRQSWVIQQLKSGVKYWFRLAALNAHGQGPWSNVVAVRPR